MSFQGLRTALLVDVNDVYTSVKEVYGNATLNYLRLTEWAASFGSLLTFKLAFSRKTGTQIEEFLRLLRNNAWECHFANKDWSVKTTLRAAEILPKVDAFLFGGTTPLHLELCKYVRDQGKVARVFSGTIPDDFREIAECFAIPSDLVKIKPYAPYRKAKPLDLPPNVSSDGGEHVA